MESLIQTLTVYALLVLFGITLHEAAHGYVARLLGDPTAHDAGRISLNPVRHIDPIGTIAVPLFLLFSTKLMGGAGLLFGWAKPVPVNWSRLRRPKQDMLWVALAGPASNLGMAIGWAIALRLLVDADFTLQDFWAQMAIAGIQVNLVLMALNLMPLPPLDGGRILVGLLPLKQAQLVARVEPYGFFIVLALVLSGIVGTLWLRPLMALGYATINLLIFTPLAALFQ